MVVLCILSPTCSPVMCWLKLPSRRQGRRQWSPGSPFCLTSTVSVISLTWWHSTATCRKPTTTRPFIVCGDMGYRRQYSSASCSCPGSEKRPWFCWPFLPPFTCTCCWICLDPVANYPGPSGPSITWRPSPQRPLYSPSHFNGHWLVGRMQQSPCS